MATERSVKTRALQKKSQELVMLAHKYSPKKHIIGEGTKRQVDITGWLMYEKIDGIRAIFKNGELISRYGNKFYAPSEFINQLYRTNEDYILDGELIHPEGFQTTTSIVRDQSKKATMEYWKKIKYVVFDYIDKNTPFEDRMLHLKVTLETSSNIKLLKDLGSVKSEENLTKQLNKIIAKGGEGLILRNLNAKYELGRSWNLLKVKEFSDTEATVIGYYDGEGRNEGKIGGLICRLKDGTEFECGTGFTDEDRANPPAINSVITITYMGLTDGGKPRHPIYKAVRDYE